jgi:hypothetical protein
MSLMGLLSGTSTFVVGVEDDPDGSLRMYVGHRARGIHTHVVDERDKQELRRAWANVMGHVVVEAPPVEALCDCTNEGAE